MSKGELYIITDVDGTVVPHPYHAGLTQEERNPFVAKLHALIHNHHVACVTGRPLKGWERLWRDAGFVPAAPRLLGLSFGAETFYHGKRIPSKSSSPELEAVIAALRTKLAEIPDFQTEADVTTTMAAGCLQGYFIEDKQRIAQIDWNFPSEHIAHSFAEKVFSILNPHLARQASLRCQVFHNRIDILSDGFVPKAELAHHVSHWVHETRLAPTEPPEGTPGKKDKQPSCLVLGDELYDDYLFESVKALSPEVFGQVRCIGVHHPHSKVSFAHADENVLGEQGAWGVIESALGI